MDSIVHVITDVRAPDISKSMDSCVIRVQIRAERRSDVLCLCQSFCCELCKLLAVSGC